MSGTTPRPRTGTGGRGAAPNMDSVIHARHVSEPGLVVLDITAADEETALALMDELQQLWATSGNTMIRRDPAQPTSAPGSTRTSGAPTQVGLPQGGE